jgi:hypothetical protein
MTISEQLLIKLFQGRGFVASCAADMARDLIKVIARPGVPDNIAMAIKDIDDIIAVLEDYKKITYKS